MQNLKTELKWDVTDDIKTDWEVAADCWTGAMKDIKSIPTHAIELNLSAIMKEIRAGSNLALKNRISKALDKVESAYKLLKQAEKLAN